MDRLSLLFIFCYLSLAVYGQIIELDDSFEEKRQDFPWLVMFYAPWCGHCRRLQPTYHQVYLDLRGSDVRVAKIDATMYSGLASRYDVRGYPTIKFIQGEKSFNHRGERSKESIIEFAKMAAGPTIRTLPNRGKFADARSQHTSRAFFLYVGDTDESVELYQKYKSVTEEFPVHAYYYAGDRKVLPNDVSIVEKPTILVFKDGFHLEFQGETKEDLERFIKAERFASFPRVADGGLNEMSDCPKKIVIVVIDEGDKENPDNDRLKDLVKLLLSQKREQFHEHYQFVWMGDPETASSIVMGHLATPTLFVLEPQNQHYYLIEKSASDLLLEDLAQFLEDVHEGKIDPQGGTGIGQRFKRLFYDIYITVYSIWKESPWLALMVFGIPSLVISIVCYALCCMEPFDEEELYNEDKEEEEEGAEGTQDSEQAPLLESDDGHMKKE